MWLRIQRIEQPEKHLSHLIRQGFRSIDQFRVSKVQRSCYLKLGLHLTCRTTRDSEKLLEVSYGCSSLPFRNVAGDGHR